jgi:Xaa-Pro aminopeptidase
MDLQLIEHLRNFLSKNGIDGLIINSTNEFLVEYNILEQNSRYYVTDFTGSMGDVLLTTDNIYQFVDSRYHEQADLQVNHDYVTVVKIPTGAKYIDSLKEYIQPYFKLGLVTTKTTKKFYDNIQKQFQTKNISVKLFNSDPVYEYKKEQIKNTDFDIYKIDTNIAGKTADEKYNTIKEYAGEKFIIVVTNLEDIAYLTNLRSYNFGYSAIFPAKAIITENGVKIYSDCKVPDIGEKYQVLPFSDFEKDLQSISKSTIFIDEEHISLRDYNLIDKSNKIEKSYLYLFKTVKNENEIEHMKSCFKKADNALKIIYNMLNSEKIYSEYDYYEALVKSMKDQGAASLSFKPIVAAGSNTSITHYSTPSKKKMVNDGDFLLIDYGGYYEGGMATDTTRTFVKGLPTPEQKRVYTTVLKAFLDAYYNKYDKKASYFCIDKIARDTITKNLKDEYLFSHGTGHGVGISVHENPPVLSTRDLSKTKIVENTVFSIEPGAYKEGWGGIRLENTVYATKEDDKFVMNTLSHFPFEIKLVDLSLMNDYEKYYYMKWQAGSCII